MNPIVGSVMYQPLEPFGVAGVATTGVLIAALAAAAPHTTGLCAEMLPALSTVATANECSESGTKLETVVPVAVTLAYVRPSTYST